MRLIVTGGAGFIGSAVVRLAIAQGHTVWNIDKLTYAANLANLDSVSGHDNYNFTQDDICDSARMRTIISAFKPDVIMHLAAESHVDRSIDGPAAFIQTNITGTFSLLEAARDYASTDDAPEHFKFHHVSTDEVFGSLGPEGAFSETSPYQPSSPYSASKAASDMLARAWGKTYGLGVVISNCSNNYGPYQFPEKLIPVVIDKARRGEEIPVYGDGSNVRDWLYVDDHAEALLRVAQTGMSGATYNIGGDAELSNLELVKKICAILDSRFPDAPHGPHASLIHFVADRPGHDQRYAVDCRKIKSELGWTPQTSLEDGIAATVDWYLTHQDWVENIKSRGYRDERLGLAT